MRRASLEQSDGAIVIVTDHVESDPRQSRRVLAVAVQDDGGDALGCEPADCPGVELRTPGGVVVREVRRAYADPGSSEPFLLVNSAGYLEVAVDRGRADAVLCLARGTTVELRLPR